MPDLPVYFRAQHSVFLLPMAGCGSGMGNEVETQAWPGVKSLVCYSEESRLGPEDTGEH